MATESWAWMVLILYNTTQEKEEDGTYIGCGDGHGCGFTRELLRRLLDQHGELISGVVLS
jgi:hypothetical protein